MKKFIYILILIVTLIVGFVLGQQHVINDSVLAFNSNTNSFELNINNHRYYKNNQVTEKLY